jgi:hypothetical protein
LGMLWQDLQMGLPGRQMQLGVRSLEPWPSVGTMLTSSFWASSPKLATHRPHLDYRCVLFGLHSVLKFFKLTTYTSRDCIKKAIFLASLEISEHLVILGFWFCMETVWVGAQLLPFGQVPCPQVASIRTTHCHISPASPPHSLTFLTSTLSFAILLLGWDYLICMAFEVWLPQPLASLCLPTCACLVGLISTGSLIIHAGLSFFCCT